MNKSAIIITLGRVSQMVVMFLTYRVLSTVLSVRDMGTYYFLLSISAAFGLVYANPIGMYVNRMIHSWRTHGRIVRNLDLVGASLFFGSLLTIPVLFIFKDKFSLDANNWLLIVSVLVSYVFSASFNGTFVPGLNLLGFTKHFVTWTLLTNVVGLGLSYALVSFVSQDPLFWLLGQSISFVIFGSIAYLIIRASGSQSEVASSGKLEGRINRVAKFALPIVVTNLAVWVLGQSFRFFYKENVDLAILGELAFGLGLATALCVAVEYLFQQLYLPKFYNQINEVSTERGIVWNKFLNTLLPSYIYVTFYIIGLAPFIMRVLADAKFKGSGYFLALGAGIELLRMLGNVFTMATQSEMKTHKAIGPYLTGGVVTLIGVLFISHNSHLVTLTPFCLMAGQLSALILLAVNVSSLIKVQIDFVLIAKSVLWSLVFLTALIFKAHSESMVTSILINFLYGIFLLFLLYRSYLQGEKSNE